MTETSRVEESNLRRVRMLTKKLALLKWAPKFKTNPWELFVSPKLTSIRTLSRISRILFSKSHLELIIQIAKILSGDDWTTLYRTPRPRLAVTIPKMSKPKRFGKTINISWYFTIYLFPKIISLLRLWRSWRTWQTLRQPQLTGERCGKKGRCRTQSKKILIETDQKTKQEFPHRFDIFKKQRGKIFLRVPVPIWRINFFSIAFGSVGKK